MLNRRRRNKLVTNAYKTAQTYKYDDVIDSLEKIYND